MRDLRSPPPTVWKLCEVPELQVLCRVSEGIPSESTVISNWQQAGLHHLSPLPSDKSAYLGHMEN